MKDGVSMSTHLNEFNSVFDQLKGKGIQLNDSLKALFLLITLPDSWDTFWTTLSDTAIVDGLSSAMFESSLLTKEVNKKNVDTTQTGNTNKKCFNGLWEINKKGKRQGV